MSGESRRMAGILLVIFPTVIYEGVNLLSLLTDGDSGYVQYPLRQDLWWAGHDAHHTNLMPEVRRNLCVSMR